ncbi:hypothetical protein C488_03540 [Natrinema pellirubrum DSM 15624]|uniref:DUF4112 domain-containing protein n=1 Tax=Natrinema pellirubrum (strain DSM 15624 / CIP 106293 / JCM 10476 / NCIMB 786 / 157) TaxID=797303 RepID=L0JHM0_NATP1|nr:DUF4112 domain-containing protein [Natrinema pellirubrum]AGB30784.1 hypothetical protein Natpe_0867 [Natrinema pellirubrum DSM 15624]ELY80830.1 hypothetical protein C488_03540 [Natrinema pellirubrum DSM 15624]
MASDTTERRSELETLINDLPAAVDDAAVTRMRVVAHALDEGVPVPGTDFRIGIDPIVGILPGAGDTVAGAVSLYLVAEAARLGVSLSTLARMIANVGVDTVVGSIPLLGVAFDAVWKANKWNLKLALQDLAAEGDETNTGPDVVTID